MVDKFQECPHKNIIDCPMYALSHEPDGKGCITSDDEGFKCMVALGQKKYEFSSDRETRFPLLHVQEKIK